MTKKTKIRLVRSHLAQIWKNKSGSLSDLGARLRMSYYAIIAGIVTRILARLINAFSKRFMFSREWRKGNGWKHWIYKRGHIVGFCPIETNVRLYNIRGYWC